MMSVSLVMAYRSSWKFWQASAPATIRRLLKYRHPLSRIALVSDNGTELTSMAVLRWCQETRIDWHYIAPGKPMQTDVVE